jgi:hypothetical protein
MTESNLLKIRERETAELQRLHECFRWHVDYHSAVRWREQRIANVDWHLSQIQRVNPV